MSVNDPLLSFQWYIDNANSVGVTPAGRDLGGVRAVWQDYIGRGIRIGVYDSGVDVTHPDLAASYDARLNPTINGQALDPTPLFSKGAPDAHGTSVAGIISGLANNGVGIAGIAYGSRFGVALITGERPGSGIDFDGPVSNEQMGQMTRFDVVNHSWGPTTPFATNANNTADANNVAFVDTLRTAAETGRNGLGTIMVVSAGNDRQGTVDAEGNGYRAFGSSNDQTFENARYMIAVAAAERDGTISEYSDASSANLVTGFGGPSEGGPKNLNVFTADITGRDGYNDGAQQVGGQTIDADFSGFNGTSAAAPTVSGVVALMLEANPRLGWRDVREILALSTVQVGSAIGAQPSGSELYTWRINAAEGWNGGGLHYSEDYGYGLVHARQAVRLAETWQGVQRSANEVSVTAPAAAGGGALPDGTATGRDYAFAMGNTVRVETAEVTLNFQAERMRDVTIELTSPGGSTSTLIRGLGDEVVSGQDRPVPFQGAFTFTSMAHMGERSGGTWTVKVSDVLTGNTVSVSSVSLRLYGEAQSADDVYVYNDAFGAMRALSGAAGRATLADSNGGRDTVNAAQLSGASVIDLNRGATSTLAGSSFTIGATSDIENAIGGDGNDDITGNMLANTLSGMRGDDRLVGGAGNDTLAGGAGSDTLDGGDGLDVALFTGAASERTVVRDGAALRITAGAEVDVMSNVERLRFNDQVLAFDTGEGQSAGTIFRVYQAAFNRAPDLAGISFWTNLFDGGLPLVEITRGFTSAPEFRTVYGANPTNRQLVDLFYQNVLGRAAEPAGVDFWTGQLNGGTTVATALSFFANAPENVARTAPALVGGIALDPAAFLLA